MHVRTFLKLESLVSVRCPSSSRSQLRLVITDDLDASICLAVLLNLFTSFLAFLALII